MRRGDHCLCIDIASGKLRATFPGPGKDSTWGYIAYADGFLIGTLADPEHVPTYRYRPGGDMKQQLTESKLIFALDADTR